MTVLIHVEVSTRELDSKLLLAVQAAKAGKPVVLGDVVLLARLGIFKKFVFHTKSLTPSTKLVHRHTQIRNRGGLITSLDEEGNLVEFGYEKFVDQRYSFTSLDLADKVFCWGKDDFEVLTNRFPMFQSKFLLTGSPRAEVWSHKWDGYWTGASNRKIPYLLISSNFGLQRVAIADRLRSLKDGGYFDRHPSRLDETLQLERQRILVLQAFLKGIRRLSAEADGFEICVRPHPRESLEAWRILTGNLPNVFVTREDSLTPWIQGCFALVQNGCTSALEATIAGKPVISLQVGDNEFLKLPNELGIGVSDPESLVEAAVDLFKTGGRGDTWERDDTILSRKISFPPDSVPSKAIVESWESLGVPNRLSPIRLFMASALLSLRDFLRWVSKTFHRPILGVSHEPESFQKFPHLEAASVLRKIDFLDKLIVPEQEIHIRFLGPRTVAIYSPRRIGRIRRT